MFPNSTVCINPQTFKYANHILLYRNIKANLQICEFNNSENVYNYKIVNSYPREHLDNYSI